MTNKKHTSLTASLITLIMISSCSHQSVKTGGSVQANQIKNHAKYPYDISDAELLDFVERNIAGGGNIASKEAEEAAVALVKSIEHNSAAERLFVADANQFLNSSFKKASEIPRQLKEKIGSAKFLEDEMAKFNDVWESMPTAKKEVTAKIEKAKTFEEDYRKNNAIGSTEKRRFAMNNPKLANVISKISRVHRKLAEGIARFGRLEVEVADDATCAIILDKEGKPLWTDLALDNDGLITAKAAARVEHEYEVNPKEKITEECKWNAVAAGYREAEADVIGASTEVFKKVKNACKSPSDKANKIGEASDRLDKAYPDGQIPFFSLWGRDLGLIHYYVRRFVE